MGRDRLVLVNLGRDLELNPAPEPLLAPLDGNSWEILWSSEDPRYEGAGIVPLPSNASWLLSGESALVLKSKDLAGRESQT